MTIRCTNCSHPNPPDSEGRPKPWCSSCGAGLSDGGQFRQTGTLSPDIGPSVPVFHGAAVSGGAQRRSVSRKPDSPWVILFIGLGCCGLGVAVVASSLGDAVNGWLSRNWSKTQGTVLRSWVEEWQSDNGSRSYTLCAIYRYSVDGKRYENNKVQFSNQLRAGDHARGAEELAKIAPNGKPCVVYYDPDDPSRSCLVPGPSLFYLIFLPTLALFFFLIGSVGTWGSARQILTGK
jgi:hypothetical protein